MGGMCVKPDNRGGTIEDLKVNRVTATKTLNQQIEEISEIKEKVETLGHAVNLVKKEDESIP